MTTIDTHVTGAGAIAGTGERADGIFAVADWITTTDHKKIGRLYIGTSLVVLLAVAAIGALLGFERIDATLRRDRRRFADAAVLAVPVRCSPSAWSLPLDARPGHRRRAAAGRRPLAGLPSPGRGRFLDLARRLGPGRRVDRRPTAVPAAATRLRRSVPAWRCSSWLLGLLAAAGVGGHHRSSPPVRRA